MKSLRNFKEKIFMTFTTHSTAIDAPLSIANSLNDEHLTQSESRGLLNDYTRATCRSITHSEAKVYVGNNAPSAGILFMGANGQIQFKPDKPRKNKKGKPIKYESVLGSEFDALLPKHPTNKDYWTKENLLKVCYWINDHPYIGITEGGWKAIAGCANGLPTVALLGVEMGLSGKASDVEGKRHLVAALRMLAEWGFGFIIIFDADAATNPDVRVAERKLARQLAKFNVPVRSITGDWDAGPNGEFKGMDDFIQHKGIEEFRAMLSKAKLFGEQESADEAPRKRKLPTARITAAEVAEGYAPQWKFDNEKKYWKLWDMKNWEKADDGAFRSLVKTILDAKNIPYKGSAYITDVVSLLTDDLRVNHWQQWDRKRFINFDNGILDSHTGELLPHCPSSGFTSCLPYKYKALTGDLSNPLEALQVNCPNIYKFFRTAMQGDERKMFKLLAIVNAVLKHRFFDLQMFVHLVGAPGSGKGKFARFLQKLVGKDNTIACQLDKLSDGSTKASVIDKQLVVFPDERKPVGIDSILSLTGGDEISYRELYKPAASAHFNGGLLICSNKLDKEIPACIAIALSVTDDAVSQSIQGIGASRIAEYKAKEWEMKVEVNSVAAFFDSELVLDPTASTSVGKFYDAYKSFCEQGGLSKFSIVKFPRLLGDILADENLPVTRHQGRIAYFQGLRMRDEADTHLTHSQVLAGVDGEVSGSLAGVDTGIKPLPDIHQRELWELDTESLRKNTNHNFLSTEEESDLEESIQKDSPPPTPATPANPVPATDITPVPTPINSRQTPATFDRASSSEKRSLREFKVGDKVVVAGPAGIYKGASGEVINVCWSQEGQECQVQFDKAVRGSLRTEISARDLMKLPAKN
jgi:putative DNA primase/helicase